MPARTTTWTRYWLGRSQGTTATAARKARERPAGHPAGQPRSTTSTNAAPPRIDQAELALAPLDDHDIALGEPPVLLRREREDAAHPLVLLDGLLEAGADLAALTAAPCG